MHMLALEGAPIHMDWVSTEAATKGLMALLATLWQETHPIVADILSLTHHNARERRSRVIWVEEYDLLPMHYPHRLSLNLYTWSINVEDEGGDIKITSVTAIRFDLDRHIFDSPHMPATLVCAPP